VTCSKGIHSLDGAEEAKVTWLGGAGSSRLQRTRSVNETTILQFGARAFKTRTMLSYPMFILPLMWPY
jgi:hypothetical protein